ncbi:FAD-dependent oxidoreductase [Geobacter sp. AOG2]|uniref:FAD-dependent oxidoreductase n=1 Tax=Geobacter sp. AOG2 TaxID=1566347 RepID=UPI001CC37DE2|nr:FAD-dependent oxidoreductase [Geobacter sp. AOG2]GFE60691.1 hypothetical protein AOG2_12790 [Geobacter sp. AOG2]
MKAWKCEICGYIHNGEGPPSPCPVCGADQGLFSLMEIQREIAIPATSGAWQCGICDYLHQGPEPPASCPVCGSPGNLFRPQAGKHPNSTYNTDIRHVIILGAGIAGITAAGEARRSSPDVKITVLSREPAPPYFRLNLTRFLAGDIKESEICMRPQQWFDEQHIDFLVADATGLDREKRQVCLRDGRTLAYDRLVLANGAHPFIPPLPGATREGVHVLRTREDANAILARLVSVKNVVCIGGGLLGLESAGALARHGLNVTVVEGFSWLLPRQLPPRAGLLLQQRLESQGLIVRCGVQVMELTGDESVHGVLLNNGEELPADLVVIAAGVRPNSHIARQSGLKVHNGVIVDDWMYTSDPAILAAGDVAEHLGKLYGIWPASYAQGIIAGVNAVGGQAEFNGVAPSNRIKVLDIDLFSIGQIQQEDASTMCYEDVHGDNYRALFCRDGQLVGAVLYGDTNLAGLLKEIVESRRQVSECPELGQLIDKSNMLKL